MTVRFARNLALLHVSSRQLEQLLRLPADVTIHGFSLNPLRDTVTFGLESDRFAPVVECAEPPSLRRETGGAGAKVQRLLVNGRTNRSATDMETRGVSGPVLPDEAAHNLPAISEG